MLPRVKLQIANNSREVTTAFVLLGILLLLGAGYVYMTPPVEEPPEPVDTGVETEEFEAFSIEAELVDSAEVEPDSPRYADDDTAPWDEQRVLTNWPAYFLDDTPDLTLNITTESNTSVDVNKRLDREERVVTTEVTETEERDWRILWENSELLMAREELATTKTADRRTFNVQNRFVNRDRSIVPTYEQLRFGSTGSSFPDGTSPADTDAPEFPESTTELETQLVLTIEYSTAEPVHEQNYSGTLRMEPRLEYNQDAYWIIGNQTASVTETQTRQIDSGEPSTPPEPEPVEGDPNMTLVAILALLGSVLLAGAGGIAKTAPKLDTAELEKQVEHEEYSEWISEGELRLDGDTEFVYVSSIEDLVNVGIDTDKRVIYDPDLSVYTVTDGDITYYYSTEPSDIERWAHL